MEMPKSQKKDIIFHFWLNLAYLIPLEGKCFHLEAQVALLDLGCLFKVIFYGPISNAKM